MPRSVCADLQHTPRFFDRAIASAHAGQPLYVIGKAVEKEAKRGNFHIA
jgi:hypothetical protein